MDKLFAPFYMNFMVKDHVKDQPRIQEIAKYILEEWNPTTVIPVHGDVIRGRTLIQNVLWSHFCMERE